MPPQLHHTSLRLWLGSPRRHVRRHCAWFGCPHSYITHHYYWYGSPHSNVRPHYVCDTGIPTATSDVTTILASPKLRHTLLRQASLRLWFGCPHSHVTTSDMGVPTAALHVSTSDMGVPTAALHVTISDMHAPMVTSCVTSSVILVSPQLHDVSVCLWFRHPHSYVIHQYVCNLGVPTATL